jgi:hypothetical protein
MKNKLIYGVGVNDCLDPTENIVNGRRIPCPFYNRWKSMIQRCYSKKYKELRPTYEGCSVSKEWLLFSNFKAWMSSQSWEGKDLDKDILFVGNKIYSENTCIFIDKSVNLFVSLPEAGKNKYMHGVNFHSQHKKFQATIHNPISKKKEHLGYFKDEVSAHNAWRKKKCEIALTLAESQSDKIIRDALIFRYSNF